MQPENLLEVINSSTITADSDYLSAAEFAELEAEMQKLRQEIASGYKASPEDMRKITIYFRNLRKKNFKPVVVKEKKAKKPKEVSEKTKKVSVGRQKKVKPKTESDQELLKFLGIE